MTGITGIAQNGVVTIGGDSAGTNEDGEQTIRADKKVFRVGEFLLGCGSSFRMIQLLKFTLELPPYNGDNIEKYMNVDFIQAVQACFEKGKYGCNENGQVVTGGEFLVGFRGRLFCMQSDFQVEETQCGYNSVGSSHNIIEGVLYATQNLDMSSEQRIELALTAAAYHHAETRPPFVILSIGGEEDAQGDHNAGR